MTQVFISIRVFCLVVVFFQTVLHLTPVFLINAFTLLVAI